MMPRALEVIIATILFLALSPVIILAAFVILVFDGKPIIYEKRTIGLGKKPFLQLKLRSMINGADALEVGLYKAYGFNGFRKKKHDPRTTNVGRFLRRFSIDELPQLLNVLKGEMALVGPRPFSMWYIEGIPQQELDLRCSVRPGMTGLAQITDRLTHNISADLKYCRERCFCLDIKIIVLTIPAVILCRGAY